MTGHELIALWAECRRDTFRIEARGHADTSPVDGDFARYTRARQIFAAALQECASTMQRCAAEIRNMP